MARKFKKNASLPILILPGYGRVHDVDVLEGEEFARFVPHYLYEITDPNAKYPVEAVAAQLSEVPVALQVTSSKTVVRAAVQPPPPPAAPAITEQTPQPSNSLLLDVLDAENAKLQLQAEEALKSAEAAKEAEKTADAEKKPQKKAKTAKKAPAKRKKAAAKRTSGDATGEQPVKRKRGRPRKNPLPETSEQPVEKPTEAETEASPPDGVPKVADYDDRL